MLESIKKLRVHVATRSMDLHDKDVKVNGKTVLDALDAIEDELSEKYMLLPLDVDGVPIRMGDKLEHTSGSWTFTADSLEIDQWGTYVRQNGQARVQCTYCHHAKPRTVENVLRDFGVDAAHELNANPDATISESTIAKYVAELCELLGYDA